MGGNVWEWVEDDAYGNYTGAPADGSPWIEDPRGSSRISRGGSFAVLADYYVRAAGRTYVGPGLSGGSIGFRLARSAP